MANLVTFGESMLRLSTDAEPLERTDELAVHVGGAESNVAVAAQRLGVDATWLSKLPDTPLGRRVVTPLRAQGVEPAVAWTDDGRQGTYFIELAGEPRGVNVIYDRDDAAVTTATAEDLRTDLVRTADAFFTTGITPALSATLRETTADLLSIARDAGVTTAFDVNYRSKLWSPDEARATLVELFDAVDVLVVAERDATDVLGVDGDAESIARALADTHEFETTVVTREDEGALAYADGTLYEHGTYPAETVDPVGTGDAFVGGFLARYLEDDPVDDALAYGAATASIKRTIPGDLAIVTPADVEAVIDHGGVGISR